MKLHPLIIALLLLPANVFAIECVYVAKPTTSNPYLEMASQGTCGTLSDDHLILNKDHLNRMSFSQNGLAELIVYDPKPIKAFYVAKSGKTVRAHYYDNGADYFEENLARTISGNKLGYINTKLEVVIPAKYDHAFPFRDGHAVVCSGCTAEYLDVHREHKKFVGGKWGVINKIGEEVIPINFTQEELLNQTKFKGLFTQKPLLME